MFSCFGLVRRRRPRFQCPDQVVNTLKAKTQLTTGQIQHLYQRFCLIGDADIRVGNPPANLHKHDFLSLQRFSRDPLFTIVLNSMFGEKKLLTFVDFVNYLSTYEAPTLKSKKEQNDQRAQARLRLLFNMYDLDKDGRIVKEDLIRIVHKLCSDYMDKEHVLNVVNIMMDEMDKSNTGQILYDDFCDAMSVFDMETTCVTRIPEK